MPHGYILSFICLTFTEDSNNFKLTFLKIPQCMEQHSGIFKMIKTFGLEALSAERRNDSFVD